MVIFCTVTAATTNIVVEKMRMCTHTYRPVIKVLPGSIYCQWDLTVSTNLAKQATCVPYQKTDPICPLHACSQMGSRVVLKWMAYMEPIFCIYTTHCLTLRVLALELNWLFLRWLDLDLNKYPFWRGRVLCARWGCWQWTVLIPYFLSINFLASCSGTLLCS